MSKKKVVDIDRTLKENADSIPFILNQFKEQTEKTLSDTNLENLRELYLTIKLGLTALEEARIKVGGARLMLEDLDKKW